MHKKDYELIARTIKEQWELSQKFSEQPQHSGLAIHQTALRLANAFGETNPLFNTEKFLTACGIKNIN